MELVIETEDFEILVDTEDKDFTVDTLICGYCIGCYSNFKKDYLVPPHWQLLKPKTKKRAKFYKLVDKYFKVKEIINY